MVVVGKIMKMNWYHLTKCQESEHFQINLKFEIYRIFTLSEKANLSLSKNMMSKLGMDQIMGLIKAIHAEESMRTFENPQKMNNVSSKPNFTFMK